jgi:hypothetical protein
MMKNIFLSKNTETETKAVILVLKNRSSAFNSYTRKKTN